MSADPETILARLAGAIDARAGLFDARRESAFRLFNGFSEGCPDLVVDLYARTVVLHNYADPPERAGELIAAAQRYLLDRFDWIGAVVLKPRHAADPAVRRGALVHGSAPGDRVRDPQGGPWYAIDLLMHQDTTLYLDTRELRRWAQARLVGKSVLNTFAYTGSLGVAAMAGGAGRVMHLDRNRAFLNLAKRSYTLNGFPIRKADFVTGDFFPEIARLRRTGARFECVFLDPPFFATTGKGTIDLERQSQRLINKVRPLVEDGGRLVAINNALYVSGADYARTLEALCADGYLAIEELIPVPPDLTGYPHTRVGQPPADPTPFNHPTKIAVLRVRRKDAALRP